MVLSTNLTPNAVALAISQHQWTLLQGHQMQSAVNQSHGDGLLHANISLGRPI
jgi:hypothetical protein